MPDYVAKQRLYHTADRSRLVEEGDPEAAFLAVTAGEVLSEPEAKARGLLDAKGLEQYQPPDPLEVAEQALQAAEERGATVEAESRRGAVAALKAARAAGGVDAAAAAAVTPGTGAPTPAESQPDSGNPHETLRAGAAPKRAEGEGDPGAAQAHEARTEGTVDTAAEAPEDVPAGEGLKAEALKAEAPKAEAPKGAARRAGGK
jgi:hypothetical protein